MSATGKLIFGADSPAIKEERVVSCVPLLPLPPPLESDEPFADAEVASPSTLRRIQTISGTGANHYGGAFLERFYEPWLGKTKEDKVIYVSNPTWGASRSRSLSLP